MRITLLGILGFLAVAALLACIEYQLSQTALQKQSPLPESL